MKRNAKTEYIREAQRAAQRLGLPSHGPGAETAIVDYCRRQVTHLTAKVGLPPTLGELLERVAACLDMEFVEIRSDEDLGDLIRRFPPKVEPALVRVRAEFGDGTDAITIKRLNPQPWERRYLAVINCQGLHYHRRFFTKWHELSHRLIDGEQLALAFRQTTTDRKEPGEILVDKVAGELAFFPDIVAPIAEKCIRESGITFKSVNALRRAVAPEASRHATALDLIRHSDQPTWLLRCTETLKLSEARKASPQNGRKKAVAKLRVVEVSPNDKALRSGVRIHRWMRVPPSSVIRHALRAGLGATGSEPLQEWTTSSGGPIGFGQLYVDTQVMSNAVLALVSIAEA